MLERNPLPLALVRFQRAQVPQHEPLHRAAPARRTHSNLLAEPQAPHEVAQRQARHVRQRVLQQFVIVELPHGQCDSGQRHQ